MGKKIIELRKAEHYRKCLICCNNEATVTMKINRVLSYDDSVIVFSMCDDCLAKAQEDIQKICE